MTDNEDSYVPLFNGVDLTGWVSKPRIYGPMWPGADEMAGVDETIPPHVYELFVEAAVRSADWSVEDGVIVGRQDEPGSGFGGFLVTERKYGDFELILEAKPDWPADTGVVVRKHLDGFAGIQVLIDHRKSGNIGGFFGNGIGSWHAIGWAIDGEVDSAGRLTKLIDEDPTTTAESITGKDAFLDFGASVEEFLDVWRVGDWNEFRIRVEGAMPTVTTWINGVKMAQVNLETLSAPNYDPTAVADFLGRSGHIGLEVHDSHEILGGPPRWSRDAACRWRNIRIKELS